MYPSGIAFGDWEEATPGHSQAKLDHKNNSSRQLITTLRAGFSNPYAGLSLRFGDVNNPDQGCLDLENSDSLVFDIRTSTSKGITVEFVDQSHQTRAIEPYRILQASLPTGSTRKAISLSIADLNVPDWWRTKHQIPLLGSQAKHLNSVCRLDLVIGGYLPNDIPDTLQLYQAYAVEENLLGRFSLGLGSIIFALLCLSGFILKHQKRHLEITIERSKHKSLSLPEHSNKGDWDRIQEWLLGEYENPDCSLEMAADQLKIPKRRISDTIKEKTDLAFREYLNSIRLREACRLLENPKMQIQNIAFTVGFGNISHFNRVFKEEMGCTPKAWRLSSK